MINPTLSIQLAQVVADTQIPAGRNAAAFLILGLIGGGAVWVAAQRLVQPIHLAIGWATTVAMWLVGYVAMMRPGLVLGELLFVLMLALVLGGGYLAARVTGKRASGVKVAVVSAVVNLLVVGSLFGGGDSGALAANGAIWVLGLVFGSAILGFIGGTLGAARGRGAISGSTPLWIFCLVSAATVLLLLVTGGLVTGLKAGLAVPDWPNSFGHNMLLYPLAEMKGGIYYEHAHRLFGTLVGLTAVVQAAIVWKLDQRRWTRALALVILVGVVAQGLLGALRVTGTFTTSIDRAQLVPSTLSGVLHGVFGQLLLAATVLLACAQSRLWTSSAQPVASDRTGKDLTWANALIAVLLVQLVLGACYRHLEVPSPDGGAALKPGWAIHAHLTMAFVVLGVGAHAALRGLRHPEERVVIRRFGGLIGITLLIQVLLGFTAWMLVLGRKSPTPSAADALFTTLHQATGALLLSFAVALSGWMYRLLKRN